MLTPSIKKNMHWIGVALLALTQSAISWELIAHRGVFHDQQTAYNTAENSLDAMVHAMAMRGVNGVEVDIRVSKDGVLFAFHDPNLNALTEKDNAGGTLNWVNVALKTREAPKAIPFSSLPAEDLVGTPLKIYGRGGYIVNRESASDPGLVTLEKLLETLKPANAQFTIMLDVQAPFIADKSAALIRRMGLQHQVRIKFWATLAIDPKFTGYNGADTCYRYARAHGWGGIQIIPEINEVNLVKGTDKLRVFGTTLSVGEYLDCWANAQKDHSGNGAAFMESVSAMYGNDVNPPTEAAANQAFDWAEKNGRKKVSVVVLPDACTFAVGRRGGRRFWRVDKGVGGFRQPEDQVTRRLAFCDKRADQCVIDVMGDFANYRASADYDNYLNFLCPYHGAK